VFYAEVKDSQGLSAEPATDPETAAISELEPIAGPAPEEGTN